MLSAELIPLEVITSKIYVIQNQRVMIDRDLATLYNVDTSQLNRQVKRNIERFPEDFMFQLTREELNNLISQNGTSSWGGTRKLTYAFTELGIAMLSSILRSSVAIQVNILIMRAFVSIRHYLSTNEEVKKKLIEHDDKISLLFDTIEMILDCPKETSTKIGFI